MFVVESMTWDATLPAGSCMSCHTFPLVLVAPIGPHDTAAAGRPVSSTSTMSLSGMSWCAVSPAPQQTCMPDLLSWEYLGWRRASIWPPPCGTPG